MACEELITAPDAQIGPAVAEGAQVDATIT